MLLSENLVRAHDASRRKCFKRESAEGLGLFRRSALAVLVAGIILAACGGPIEDVSVINPAPSNLILELPPVGSPSISALRGYEFPEMFPAVVNQAFRIDGYEAPQMWPEASEQEYVEPSSGLR